MDNDRYYQLGSHDKLFNQIDELTDALASRDAEVAELKKDVEEESEIRERLAKLLAETAIALKGEEAELTKHSWHDLAWCAAQVVYDLDQLREQVTLLRDALTESRRELDSCQKVIWLASDYGFDTAYVKGAQASIRKTDEALAATKHHASS